MFGFFLCNYFVGLTVTRTLFEVEKNIPVTIKVTHYPKCKQNYPKNASSKSDLSAINILNRKFRPVREHFRSLNTSMASL